MNYRVHSSFFISMSFALSRKFPRNLYVANSVFQVQQPWPTKRIYPKSLKRYQRTYRQPSQLLGKSLQKRHLIESLISSPNSQSTQFPLLKTGWESVRTVSMPGMQNMWARRFWLLHNALPLALHLKPMKTNMLHGLERRAVLPLKVWCGQPGIKFLQKVANTSLHFAFSQQNSHIWNFITALECYAPISLTRMGWTSQPNEGRFWMKHHKVQMNGFTDFRTWYVQRPADLIVQSKQSLTLWDKKLMNSILKDTELFLKSIFLKYSISFHGA